MNEAVNSQGEPIFSLASVIALIVLFMLSLQCLSTTAIVYKETQSKVFTAVQFLALNLVAYGMAVLTFNVVNLF